MYRSYTTREFKYGLSLPNGANFMFKTCAALENYCTQILGITFEETLTDAGLLYEVCPYCGEIVDPEWHDHADESDDYDTE